MVQAADLPALVDLVGECRRSAPRAVLLHRGDVQWQLALMRDWEGDVHMWEDGVGGAALAISDSTTGEVLWLAHARAPWLGAAALTWALDHLRSEGVATAHAAVPDADATATGDLEASGFVRGEQHFVELRRDLEMEPPAPAPPPGFELATLATAGSAEAFVELHRDAWARWGPSSYSIDAHRRLEAMPGYDPALVPVAVAPDGRLACSCVCWLDAATLVGEIEPLGTGRAFERLGLGRAIVLEACRLMRARGMRTAYVSGASVNAPALAMYASAGFQRGRRTSTWTCRLNG